MSEKKEQKYNDGDTNREDQLVSHVHSANKWETADLGETDRKSKFLRLMGAAKKEHHGKFVIGDQNPNDARKKMDEHQLDEDLETQFVQGLEHQRIGGRRGHIGLGYNASQTSSGQQPSNSSQAQTNTSEEHSNKPSETSNKEEKQECAEKKTENTSETSKKNKDVEEETDETKGKQDELGPSSAKKYKMSFVKSSS